ncbi:MAG: hypothetical protein HQL58_11115 [Magnetococcales bacterium]|nr:hypothetical protein [Magnetococcales bacterium]
MQVDIEPLQLQLTSQGNVSDFTALTWNGYVSLRVNEALLPWLSLLALCGGGENADKGFGGIELIPLS